MKNILVTIDFNEKPELLIDQAFKLAKALGSKIWLMHIVHPEPNFVVYGVGPPSIKETREKILEQQHKLLENYAVEIQEKGVDAEDLLIKGPTIELIISESQKLNINLIITGYNEHGFLYKEFIGSVSAEVLKKSKIPVLLVPID